jgi:hypothetical protein
MSQSCSRRSGSAGSANTDVALDQEVCRVSEAASQPGSYSRFCPATENAWIQADGAGPVTGIVRKPQHPANEVDVQVNSANRFPVLLPVTVLVGVIVGRPRHRTGEAGPRSRPRLGRLKRPPPRRLSRCSAAEFDARVREEREWDQAVVESFFGLLKNRANQEADPEKSLACAPGAVLRHRLLLQSNKRTQPSRWEERRPVAGGV